MHIQRVFGVRCPSNLKVIIIIVIITIIITIIRRKEMFYLTTHSTHFIYGYMASDIW